MPHLPDVITALLQPFAVGFAPRTWPKAQVLLTGAILTPRKCTVSSALHVLGFHERADFTRYHQVLNRAVWSSLTVSRVLWRLRLQHRVADPGRVWRGIDETVERRWGPRIAAKGVYRDGVRSSHGHFVPAMGLRWISLMLRVSLPWTRRVWALPFLTVRAPSMRCHEARGRRHKTLTVWARQMLYVVRRWRPDRDRVVVGDRSYAALPLLAACQALTPAVTFLTRLRLDAALYAPAPPPTPGPRGRPRLKGHRLPSLRTILADPATRWTPLTLTWPDGTVRTLVYASGTAVGYHPGHPPVPLRWRLLRDPAGRQAAQALLRTDPTLAPLTLLSGYLRRGSVEVTFQEVRAHLGVQTQRQGSDKAILRTTPTLRVSSAGSCWWPMCCAAGGPSPVAGPLGTASPTPPSPMSSPACAARSGRAPPFLPCRRSGPTRTNPRPRRWPGLWISSAIRIDCTKSSSAGNRSGG